MAGHVVGAVKDASSIVLAEAKPKLAPIETKDFVIRSSSFNETGGASIRPKEQQLEAHYSELMKLISEIGKDIKPAYTNSKLAADRLRKNIVVARGVLRECVSDLDKLSGTN
ncbi:hypothetical protein EMCRGX_G025058 [Ephydatia muelleri]|eukprot:Em0015g1208a